MAEHPGSKGGPGPSEHDDLESAGAEELAAARRLRDALDDRAIPSDDAELARALTHAWSPGEIAPSELDAIVAAALDGASPDDVADVARALDGGAPTTAEGELAVALRVAWSPAALGTKENDALVARALGATAAADERAATAPATAARTSNVVRVAFGASVSVLALAASLILWIGQRDAETPAAPLARARSTQPLFAEPFRAGEASARIDRIALARASDLRDNRFARWGVKR